MSPRQIDSQTRDQREEELLDAAMILIGAQGVEGLTMDKLVSAVPYSKGTVYGHFSGKEDLLLALCNRGMALLVSMFKRAESFEGVTRERLLAWIYGYQLYARLYPMFFMLVITAKAPGVAEKSSERQREKHIQLQALLSEGLLGLIRQALETAECGNPLNMTAEQIAFANWSASFGSISLLSKGTDRCNIRAGLELEESLLANVSLVLDGLNWRPLSSLFDYNTSLERIRCEIFADEVAMLTAGEMNQERCSSL
ncbi:transcriptional regulator, TetR family [Amphritea atlantica]|uniref:Transcriptional regulator, TetR family n=1 Tax=Amphritea atlantica TaxID=355243 RepID=A0A1H9D552_9GAMM|nr:TetR/AcrR family transcriptional regulator [Amphritea atlantica]SEQ08575.1 transcriptional regulator, TetR family [Amphritea atlantica]